jgi:hypothetical protein
MRFLHGVFVLLLLPMGPVSAGLPEVMEVQVTPSGVDRVTPSVRMIYCTVTAPKP